MNGERPGAGRQRDPAGLETARVVVREGRRGRAADPAREQAGPDQDLEPVADAQDQAAPLVEPPQGVAQDRTRAGWPGSARHPGRRRTRIRPGSSGSGRRRATSATRQSRPTCQVSTSAPARSQAAAVSSSQLVPGRSQDDARGGHVAMVASG